MAEHGGGRSQLREPRQPPMVLSMQSGQRMPQQGVALQGVGRGFSQMSSSNPSVGQSQAGFQGEQLQAGRPQMSYIKQQLSNANSPLDYYEQNKQLIGNYIPGLHREGENYPQLPAATKPDYFVPKGVTVEFIKDYKTGNKNPIMVVHEYCSILKLSLNFQEQEVEVRSLTSKFACACSIDGKTYPQGVGSTKKLAKTNAAKIAFDIILEKGHDGGDGEEKTSTEEVRTTDPSADPMNLGHKNPIMQLYEYCARKQYEVCVSVSDGKTPLGFQCDITINKQNFCTEFANNKQEAKRRAGELAVRMLLNKDQEDKMNSADIEQASHFDQIASRVQKKIYELTRGLRFPWNNMAGFVVKRSMEDPGEVVAVAAGDSCILDEYLTDDGRSIIDSHAEALAHRALIKWLYRELKNALFQSEESIFEINDTRERFRMKESVSIHMYISTAPCGDAEAFDIDTFAILGAEESELIMKGLHIPNFKKESYGKLRVKGKLGCVTAPFDRIDEAANSFKIMSCSDKILKWNILGLQGSLLSYFLEPVYMNSLTLGSKFDLGHLVRAVCCRLPDGVNEELPPGYSIRHPLVGRVSVYVPMAGSSAFQDHSLNWCADDKLPEILDCRDGKSLPESPFRTGTSGASRLSKAGFNHRFRELAKQTRQEALLKCPTYGELKSQSADQYNLAKETFYKFLSMRKFGQWLRRPTTVDSFN